MVAQDPKENERLFDSTVQKNRPAVEQFFLDEVTGKGNFLDCNYRNCTNLVQFLELEYVTYRFCYTTWCVFLDLGLG